MGGMGLPRSGEPKAIYLSDCRVRGRQSRDVSRTAPEALAGKAP